MIYFHYCSLYLANTTTQVDKTVKKKLTEYANRPNLKGIKALASYTGRILVLNISNPHYKVILEEERININGEECRVCFVRDIISMGQNYSWLQTYVEIRDGKWHEYNPLPESDIEIFKSAHLNSSNQTYKKDFPPALLTNWHHSYKLKVEYNIYETDQWVKFALSASPTDGMKDDEVKLYRLALLEIIKESSISIKKEVLKTESNYQLSFAELNDVGIIYNKIEIEGETIWLLLGGANILTQNEHWKESKSAIVLQQYTTIENVQRVSLRAYPSWALNDAEMWKAIQKNKETGNLSLLPEQTIFLKEFTFPKYINGQAGSGKSTMLYYLFANAYYYKCFGEIKGDIIFLTENEELLKHTKSSVIELLQCNPEFELSLDDISNVDNYFTSFKRFLLEQLPEGVMDFPPEKYLDFSKFKILYESSNVANHIKEKFSAELTWFCISTYIFGYDIETQITHENYEVMMQWEGKQLISIDDLRRIETIILPFYKKLIDQDGYWDKIKIIKYLRNNVPITKAFEVIFCDEAQDFSRVELRFILSLSEYVKYDLSQTLQVPIVFAGDALQTVNPTGFRSAEVKDMLYEELKEIAEFDLKTDKIEYAPSYNYRSSQPIVNVANAIQYFRKNEFTADIKSPQIAKRPEIGQDAHINVFIDYNTLVASEVLQRKLEYKTFIIPTNVDEKQRYIESNAILNNFVNVKCAVEAKGIDYDQVVLFGFGEYGLNIPQGDEYERRFFYNKLYVGVTRAQYELVVIDASDTQSTFWQPLISNYAASDWAQLSEVKKEVINDTICYGAEQIPSIRQSTPEIALANAQKDKKQGIIDKNPSLLRVAASQFLRLGVKKEHFLCYALMYEFLENWNESANYFLKKEVGIDGLESAANAYWQGKMLTELSNLNIKSPTHSIRLLVVLLLKNNTLQHSELRTLYDQRQMFRNLILHTPWRKDIIESLIAFLSSTIDDDQLKYLIDIFNEIAPKSDIALWKLIGEKNYYLRRYEAAIEAFESINDDGILFIKSNIEIASRRKKISEFIFWKGRLVYETASWDERTILEEEIIEVYLREHTQVKLTSNAYTWLYIYFSFLLRAPQDGQLFEIAQTTEKLFLKKESDLVYNYSVLLKSQRLHPSITNFVISRWAKNSYKAGIKITAINEDYKQIASYYKIKEEIFSEQEILDIPELPDRILAAPPNHFYTIEIKNFRSFQDIRVENIGLINLIVGDNNIGKTSFLEALLFSPNKKEYLNRLAFSYIERRNVPADKEETSTSNRLFYKLTSNFLNDFKNNNGRYFQVEVTVEEKRAIWKYKIQKGEDVATNNILLDSYTQNLTFNDSDYLVLQNLDFLDAIKQPFMPYGKGYSYDLVQAYFDEIGIKPKVEEKFLHDMRIFIPNIKRIVADTKNGVIEILDEDFPEEFTPLHQYGEGANKLFRILVLLSIHKGKKVLIDEIDAGIHYSRFKKFWKTILEIAGRDKTQLFVTTHNDECIEYFNEVLLELSDLQHNSRVIQLKKVNGIVKVRSYEYNSFSMAIQDNVELRGGIAG